MLRCAAAIISGVRKLLSQRPYLPYNHQLHHPLTKPHAHSSNTNPTVSTRNVPPDALTPPHPHFRTQPRHRKRPPTLPTRRRLLPRNSALQRILRERAYGPDSTPANIFANTHAPRSPNDPRFVATHTPIVPAAHASIPNPRPTAHAREWVPHGRPRPEQRDY